MANKRKTTTAIVAGVTAVALLLGGTFAWTSISQQAKNETAGVVNVGGRLHDDFNGTNKDVYVENFTDPYNGGQPIYARVKLTEYMEVGQDAGGFGADVDGDEKIEVVPVVPGTDINDVKTWKPHVPSESCAICATEGTCVIHDHWTWTMGGDNGTTGSTTFMPTFNKDKDSLAADINGTYHGTDNTDKVYYDDYVVYTTDANGLANVPQAEIADKDGEILSVDGTAYYDDDPTHDENIHDENIGAFRTEPETHTAKQTSEGTVILMKDWNGQPGNYWVYDTDGWAYWANPIMPGEATGLLLDGIEMYKNPGEKCYYAINVVGQFATVNDWEYFDEDNDSQFDGTDDALTLLETVSKNVATVIVTNESGETLLTPGEEYKFSARVSLASGAAAYAAGDFAWSVYNKDLTVNTSATITENEDGTATLVAGYDSSELIIVAKATGDQYLGAVGTCSVAVTVSPNEIVTTDNQEGSRAVALLADGTLTFVRVDNALYTSEITEGTYHGVDATAVYDSIGGTENTIVYDFENVAFSSGNSQPWSGQREQITKVVFADTIKPTSTAYWFYGMENLTTLDGSELDVSKAESFAYMLGECVKLTEIKGISDWDTGNVENMTAMFYNTDIVTLDIGGWDTSNVKIMQRMFWYCYELETVGDLSGWDTSSVTDMYRVFGCCTALKTVGDLSGWDTGNVENMGDMFSLCSALSTQLDLRNWNVNKVTNYTGFSLEVPADLILEPIWVN